MKLSRSLAAAVIAAGFIALGQGAAAQDELPTITIGYLDLAEDIRYDDWGVHPVDIRSATAIGDRRAYAGAELGLEELKSLQRVAKAHFALRRGSLRLGSMRITLEG